MISYCSWGSVGVVISALSAFSIASVGSVLSIASLGSTLSVLSIASTHSVLSIASRGCAFAVLRDCTHDDLVIDNVTANVTIRLDAINFDDMAR